MIRKSVQNFIGIFRLCCINYLKMHLLKKLGNRLENLIVHNNIFFTNPSNLFLVKVLFGRELSGPQPRRLTVPSQLYNNLQLLRKTLGHLSAVYCVLFDRTGRYIATVSNICFKSLYCICI